MAIIYKITNQINGKVYIGETLKDSIDIRWKEHKRDRTKRKNEKRPLYDAMNKYGIENFTIEEIDRCKAEEVQTYERYWINKYRSYIGFEDCNGYNATLGGDGRNYADYELIFQLWKDGNNITQIHNKTGYDADTISNALNDKGVTKEEKEQRRISVNIKSITAYDKNGNLIQAFNSQSDAARWIIEQGKSKAQVKNIVTLIGKVSRGIEGRSQAYGYIWKDE